MAVIRGTAGPLCRHPRTSEPNHAASGSSVQLSPRRHAVRPHRNGPTDGHNRSDYCLITVVLRLGTDGPPKAHPTALASPNAGAISCCDTDGGRPSTLRIGHPAPKDSAAAAHPVRQLAI